MRCKRILFLLLAVNWGLFIPAFGQFVISTYSKVNTKCNGVGCNYYGPSILINEVMIQPSSGDGSIYGGGPGAQVPQAGEWIELYNPQLCKSVDISCYFLGNTAYDGSISDISNYGGGFELPQGTIVPPRGFCVVRGINATPVPSYLLVQNGGRTVEVIIDDSPSVCIGGGFRLWFPDDGGWFAFYDQNGVAQDAISWNNVNTEDYHPCNPTGNCPFTGQLPSYTQIPSNHKNYIYNFEPPIGHTIDRQPDGGPWAIDMEYTPTLGKPNGVPVPAPVITCNGKASVNVLGGSPPFTIIWNDGQSQTTDTAVGLCAGTYCVTVTDGSNSTQTMCVTVTDFVPSVILAVFDTICENTSPFVMTQGSPPGGVYSGDGISGTTFDPLLAGIGTHKIFYDYYTADSCYNIDSSLITIFPGANITMPASMEMCIDAPGFMLTGATPAGGTYSGTGVLNGYFSPAAAGPGPDTISYQVDNSAYCAAASKFVILVNALPVMGLEPFPDICKGTPIFTLSGGTPPGGTYSGEGVASNMFDPIITGVGTFPITYSYKDENNCFDDTTRILAVSNLPVIHAIADPGIICRGDSSSISAFGAAQYTWFPIQVSNAGIIVSPQNTTLYHVEGVDSKGCHGTDSCIVTVIPLPEVNLPEAVWVMTGEPVELASFSGPFQYLWSTGQTSQTVKVTQPGFYWVMVSDTFCTARDTVEVIEIPAIFVPNAFTPNDDGLNDVFGPITDDRLSIRFWIFTRWGERIFESKDLQNAWDGTYKGNPAPCDVYTWVLEWDYTYLTRHQTSMAQHGKKQGIVVLIR